MENIGHKQARFSKIWTARSRRKEERKKNLTFLQDLLLLMQREPTLLELGLDLHVHFAIRVCRKTPAVAGSRVKKEDRKVLELL